MTRVDRYNDEYVDENNEKPQKEVSLSRVSKHQNMYDEIYMNTTFVDINNILDEEESSEVVSNTMEIPKEVETYEEKSYSVNEYLEKAHEKISPDNAKRDINNDEFREQEDEIRRLIDSINEKEEEEDFFKDLKGDNEDTLVGAKLKTDEFNDSIYEALKMDSFAEDATILDHVLSDKTVVDLEQEEEKKLDHTFEEIINSDNKSRRNSKKLPIIIFSITLFILIAVILIIIFK